MRRLTAAVVLFALLSCAAYAAQERVTPLVVAPKGDRLDNCYMSDESRPAVESLGGKLPLVDFDGKHAVKVHVSPTPGLHFQIGLVYGGWVTFYLADYVPEGTLEFDLTGRPGPDTTISIVDKDKDGAGPDKAVSADLNLAHYVKDAEGWQHVSIPITDFVKPAPDLGLDNMEKLLLQGPTSAELTFYLADVAFHTTHSAREYLSVKVDQVGYPVGWHKLAKVTPPWTKPLTDGTGFVVKDADTGKTAFEGKLKVALLDDDESGDDVYDADFTALDAPGTYVVEVQGLDRSAPFRIGKDVYSKVFYDVSRFWFYQRCGMALDAKYAAPDAHPACHVFDKAIPDPLGGTRDCEGGWHDAGDMNRYTPWTVGPVFMLLTLYRYHPAAFTDGQMNIPESGNGVPDLLDEVKYELQWVRKMLIREGPDAGKVYDRVHESLVAQPEGVSFYDQRHGLSGTTDEAACALVADLAYANLIYRDFPQEQDFAKQCLDDALLSWDYLNTKGKPQDAPMFTAAALLFEATGRQDALHVVRHLSRNILKMWSGQIVYGTFDAGLATYALSERPEVDKALQAQVRAYYKSFADATVQAAQSKGYNTPMIDGVVYVWGSNGRLAKIGAHLLLVNRFAPDPKYVATAQETLHWMLGRNPVNTCMVTGYGTPPLGPIFHHMYDPTGPGLPMPPGYLPGGIAGGDCPGISSFPAKVWRPDWTNYALTEPSLGYQGPFTYLLGSLALD